MRARAGFSLVEAQVALVLLAAGLLAVAATGVQAIRLLQRAEIVHDANALAASVLDSLAQVHAPVSGSLVQRRVAVTWTATPADSATLIVLVARYTADSRVRADTFAILAGVWPERISHVP
jgi:Tfp pilus assembly protein PilV